jgi:hypothetical protein
MTTINLRLPDSLHQEAREVAARENTSLNSLIMLALAEKIALLQSGEMLRRRAQRGARDKFDAALAVVPDTKPVDSDSL